MFNKLVLLGLGAMSIFGNAMGDNSDKFDEFLATNFAETVNSGNCHADIHFNNVGEAMDNCADLASDPTCPCAGFSMHSTGNTYRFTGFGGNGVFDDCEDNCADSSSGQCSNANIDCNLAPHDSFNSYYYTGGDADGGVMECDIEAYQDAGCCTDNTPQACNICSCSTD